MPAFVRPDQSNDGADTAAPRRANSRRTPIRTVVWSTASAWIVEESERDCTSDRAADGALDHARTTRHALTDVETAHRSAWDR
jgi:hypothetical protein